MQNETEFKGGETKFFLAWFWEAKHLRSLELSVLNFSLQFWRPGKQTGYGNLKNHQNWGVVRI